MNAPLVDAKRHLHHRTCTLCEALCGLELTVEGGRVTHVRGDAEDPFSRGHICPKGAALGELHADPDRLTRPLERTATGFREVSWEAALERIGQQLHALVERHGPDAIGLYFGNPAAHNYATLVMAPALLLAFPTKNRFSASSADQLPHTFAQRAMFGHSLLFPVVDLDRTDLFVILGGNPLASNGSMMTAPDVAGRLRALRERGGRLVVIDPRLTETAKKADQHLAIQPGTDALLLWSLLHVVFRDGLESPELKRDRPAPTRGLERLRELARRFPPERVAPVTGLDPAAITALARQLATTPRAAIYGRMGICTQRFGGQAAWLVYALATVTGHLDREGGLMFTTPAVDTVQLTNLMGRQPPPGRWRSRVGDLPEFAGELPVSALADEIETPGERQIRALITVAGNPVLSTPNGARLERAMAGLSLRVSLDCYLNETSRLADYILPAPGPLERDHYGIAFHTFAVRNTAKYSRPLFEAPAGSRHDWQILLELAERMLGHRRDLGGRARSLALKAARRLEPRQILDLGLRLGPHGLRKGLREGLSLATLERHPHGLDLGPLEPRLPGRLMTPDKHIELAPEAMVADVPRLEAFLDERLASPEGGLVLIGRRQLRGNNSWLHNVGSLMKGKPRCTLLMHPEDAARRGLVHGMRARVTSRTGSVVAPVELDAGLRSGVVSLPHGFGHGRPGVRLAVAGQHPGVSINDLTDERHCDALTGNAGFSGVPVVVEPA